MFFRFPAPPPASAKVIELTGIRKAYGEIDCNVSEYIERMEAEMAETASR